MKREQMTLKISNQIDKNQTFCSKESSLFAGLKGKQKIYNGFIKSQENLSHTRFIQAVATNWVPKAVFARSLADFTEMTFLELSESALFFFAPAVFGGFLQKNITRLAPKKFSEQINKNISKSAEEIISNKALQNSGISKRVLPIKAGIVLACIAIPAGEYALSFAKNLLTLKLFKKSNFDNIANLNKGNQKEDLSHQEKVKKSAQKNIKNSSILAVSALASGVALALVGHKSQTLQNISKGILRPGNIIYKGFDKIGLKFKTPQKAEKFKKILNTYINFDFDTSKGSLGLSKGQLVVSTLAGLYGYSQAGKDRGKLDQLEVLTRVPIVAFYTVFGSEIFDSAFKKILIKKNKFSDLVKKDTEGKITIPKREEIAQIAQNNAKTKKISVKTEFDRLLKEKAIITAIPYGFSLLFMGFLLAGISRCWTQYRFNQAKINAREEKPKELVA